MEAPLDGCVLGPVTRDIREENNLQRTCMRVKLSRGCRLNRREIKSPPGNGPYCFRIDGQIYHLVSPLYPSEADKPEALGSAIVTTRALEDQ